MRASLARNAIAERLAFQGGQQALCFIDGNCPMRRSLEGPPDCFVCVEPDGDRIGQFIQRQQDPLPVPVPVDSRVRGRAEVVSIDEKGGGWWEVVTRFTLEVEATRSPASWATASPR